ncbi:hypothetical protein WKI68_41915 [Streptomyces sp. MS1.HAVA.3]|uniref:Uncharacterized protein n=1 Tax=Streptomyces caledonius TaxID=3134107 RepID=A0ABU8UDQ2_9ACTN
MDEVQAEIPRRRSGYLRTAAVAVTGLVVGGLITVVVVQQRQIDGLRDESTTANERCEQAKQVVFASVNPQASSRPGTGVVAPDRATQATAKPEPDWRKAANAVQQNPDCFSVDDRATAQTWLDQLDAG